MVANVESMVYYGEVPWHGLGVSLDNPATSEEAIKAAGLDWDVDLVPVFVNATKQEKFQAVMRKTDGVIYNIVRGRYQPLQNRKAFEFFDGVVGEGQAIYHTAGSLGKGEKIWIMAKLPNSFGIRGDEVEKFVVLSNSHDGSQAVQMFWTPIRVVCQNTLGMAQAGANKPEVFYSRHTIHMMKRVTVARDILGMADRFYEEFEEKARWMASHSLPEPRIRDFLEHVFQPEVLLKMEDVFDPTLVRMEDLYKPRKAREMVEVRRLMEEGKGLDNSRIRGTNWGAYNALVEYVDYEKVPRKGKEGARLNSIWFGKGADLKQRAWDYLSK